MNKWKHLNFEQRKIIKSGLSQNKKLYEIAELLECDPTTISKEIKRNRILHYSSTNKDNLCPKIKRFPYCCNACNKRYGKCFLTKYLYEPTKAQELANSRLRNTRRGIDMSEEEFLFLDNTIKNGVDNGESIYHIVKNNPNLNVSVPTVYRYINQDILKTKRMDLPYAVTYKKRKKRKDYEYRENRNVDRFGRTYIDFLKFKFNNPNCLSVEMDFLGHIKSDKKSILVMTIPHLHFVMLFILKQPNNNKVVDVFNKLEVHLGSDSFSTIFTCVLTDRDPCFVSFQELETSALENKIRTKLFYCDPNVSSQKGNVEQMNKQLRKFFPKKNTIDHLTQNDMSKVASIINSTRVASLSGFTPNEAFINLFGEKLLEKLNNIII